MMIVPIIVPSRLKCSLRRPLRAASKAATCKASTCFVSVHSGCLPPTVNWHLEPRCNYNCKFCFATFTDIDKQEVLRDAATLLQVPKLLAEAGANKINFVGGEPFLHPLIVELIKEAKTCGLVTSVVTNGSRLTAGKLLELRGHLDWLAFSVDASNDDVHAAMGRGVAAATTFWPERHGVPSNRQHQSATHHTDTEIESLENAKMDDAKTVIRRVQPVHEHLHHVLQIWPLASELGYRMKLNTVVCKANLQDDMVPLVLRLRPERWKVFQVLPIEGQNSGDVDDLLISEADFQQWCSRHRTIQDAGIPFVPEDNNSMKGSYAMLDARCRFYTNKRGRHEYGPSIFDAQGPGGEGGVEAAWAAVADDAAGFDIAHFGARGGVYDWGQGAEVLHGQVQMVDEAKSRAMSRV